MTLGIDESKLSTRQLPLINIYFVHYSAVQLFISMKADFALARPFVIDVMPKTEICK